MDDYIRRGAAIEQFEDSTSAIPEKLARIRIESVPAADVVEVVRCRDCFNNAGESRDLWGNPVILCVTAVKHEPDWYCASGKRKDGGQNDGD